MADAIRAEIGRRDLAEFRRDLESVKIGLGREVAAALRDSMRPVVTLAAQLAPYDPKHRADRKDNLGHIRDSLTAAVLSNGAAIVSSHPAAVVHEYGTGVGSIAPQGVPIRIRQSAFAHRAGERNLSEFERRIEQHVDALVARHLS